MSDPNPGQSLAPRLGIFARTFPRPSATQVAAAVKDAGYALAHWNFAALGLPTLAVDVPEEAFIEVRASFGDAGLHIPSVSATYNTIDTDAERRGANTRSALRLIRAAPLLGAEVVTLCTGTRHPDDMWRAHPLNTSAAAWRDLRATLEELMAAAADGGVILGIEPEPGNVIADAARAARLLDELGGDAPVGIVFDPANLLGPATLHRQREILTDAVAALGPRIVAAQAKDVTADGAYAAAGDGLMDYGLVFRLMDRIRPVPLIVQDVTEADAVRVREHLLRRHRERL